MGQNSSNEVFNFISVFFIALSALVCALSLMISGDVIPAGPLEPATDIPAATLVFADYDGQFPQFTPSDTVQPTEQAPPTATFTITPTWTGLPTNTGTPTSSPTPTDTPLPSATFTLSPTWTFTPSPSETPTITLPPPTQPPAQNPPGQNPPPGAGGSFTVPPSFPIYRDAFAHPGCEWQGIGGQVNGPNGPLPGITLKVTLPDSTTQTAVTGTAPSYGQSGYEIAVGNAPAPGTYQIQVVGADGTTPLSGPITIQFPGTCEQNLALVNFIRLQ